MKAVIWRTTTTLAHTDVDLRSNGDGRYTAVFAAGVTFDADDMLDVDGRMLLAAEIPTALPDGRTAAVLYDPKGGR